MILCEHCGAARLWERLVMKNFSKNLLGIKNNSYLCSGIIKLKFMPEIKITKIWFDAEHLAGEDENGNVYKQSLLWYQKLKDVSDEERNAYSFGFDGIHWRNLDVDVSFESFLYEDAEPSDFQRFFLVHKEINITEFAKIAGINATLLRNYINGFKKPSKERENEILEAIHKIGKKFVEAKF